MDTVPSPIQDQRKQASSHVHKAVRLFAFLLMAFAIALPLVNLLANWWQLRQNPVPGEWFVVEGRRMHLDCMGAGSPTLVIEAAAGSDWLNYQNIQPRLAKMTRVCTYDRSGLGWSEPSPGRHDAETNARKLHELLDTAKVPRPLVLAGASAGGFYVREFARQFPSEVVGVVLLDSSCPSQLDKLPGSRQWYDAEKRNRPRAVLWQKLRVSLGWQRLVGGCHGEPYKGEENLAGYFDAEMCRPRYEGHDTEEFLEFEDSAKQAARLTSFGDIPLLVISQDPARPKQGWTQQAIDAQPIWAVEQENLKTLSPKSWRVVAAGSPHHVTEYRPDLVLQETSRLLEYLKGGPAPPFGSTSTR